MRRIVCNKCFKLPLLHPEDVQRGFRSRHKVIERVKVPEFHTVTVTDGNGEVLSKRELSHIHCDNCNAVIPEGASCHAVTVWRRGQEIGEWESGFEQ